MARAISARQTRPAEIPASYQTLTLLLGSASYLAYFPDRGLSVTMNVNAAAYDEDGAMLADRLFGELMVTINE